MNGSGCSFQQVFVGKECGQSPKNACMGGCPICRHFKLGLSFYFLVSGYHMKQLAAVLCLIYYMVKKFVQYWGKTWPI